MASCALNARPDAWAELLLPGRRTSWGNRSSGPFLDRAEGGIVSTRREGMTRFRMALMLGLAMALAMPGMAQKQLAGEWQGTVTTDSGDLQILWHVTAAADGTLTSTFDNSSE